MVSRLAMVVLIQMLLFLECHTVGINVIVGKMVLSIVNGLD